MADEPSVRERIFDAVAAVLAAVPGVHMFRVPLFDLEAGDLPAVCLIEGGEEPRDDLSGALQLEYRLTVGLACGAPGVRHVEAGGAITRGLTRLRAQVRAALAQDVTLGGLADYVRYTGADDPVFVTAEGGKAPYGVMFLSFAVEGEEGERDPYSLGR